ncbi:arylesterase [Nioella sediminis]|uniref:arylesterase n=1 Tax=Nioella sediminis TaxID=1912092 RepID=UPI0008FD947C|nr:arylesterase [Nioella sediminis]TBX28700.1 GDSL family lipase [Roseovarius sp. JS7-11]
MKRLRAYISHGYGGMAGLGKAAVLAFGLCAAPSWADEVVIAALGDSLTQGYGLPAEQGFVPQLEAWLQARGHEVRLINAGVSGDTTAGGLARIGWTLTSDVQALIVTLGGNDLLRGLPPEAARASLAGILDAAGAAGVEVLLVGMEAPLNYGPDYQAAFDAIYPDLAADYGTLYAESFLAPVVAAPDLRAVMQADGIHPNADGVALIVEALGPAVEALLTRVQQP